VNKSLALCFVRAEHAGAGNEFDIAILGKPHAAVQLVAPPFDPKGERLRA
jgi:dimethylglycine dehydrogenase